MDDEPNIIEGEEVLVPTFELESNKKYSLSQENDGHYLGNFELVNCIPSGYSIRHLDTRSFLMAWFADGSYPEIDSKSDRPEVKVFEVSFVPTKTLWHSKGSKELPSRHWMYMGCYASVFDTHEIAQVTKDPRWKSIHHTFIFSSKLHEVARRIDEMVQVSSHTGDHAFDVLANDFLNK